MWTFIIYRRYTLGVGHIGNNRCDLWPALVIFHWQVKLIITTDGKYGNTVLAIGHLVLLSAAD